MDRFVKILSVAVSSYSKNTCSFPLEKIFDAFYVESKSFSSFHVNKDSLFIPTWCFSNTTGTAIEWERLRQIL
ncbi:uncharacterized protein Gasu_07510 [Galdieria sulphuraria]|uniref:Uncharacterized protein n=1 Tax=Galdieria sulphuraria TaxID=130081 RepID=M2X674_GALSU|nr:uncharacterized protein Gasu_07510 [Galdieria sulphuraria]EME32005.1 hypothetical protein Gasu_07510 [Galdieria sulphuraria]|eukprot:XP_005708525.1 hypothetical protein Gasu_07510 [Galdieria sulphuraria]